jgi:hypothetical protein
MTAPPYLSTLTLLSHVQNVCDECGFTRPTAVIGGTSADARQYLAVANRAVEKIRNEFSWAQLHKEHTFSTVSGTEAYALPSDFEEFLTDTLWNRSDYERMVGPLTPSEWAHEKGSNVTASIDSQYRVKGATGTQFYITPIPDSVEGMTFEYKSKSAILDNDNSTMKERFAEDTDRVLVPQHLFELALKWMLRKEKKLEYDDHLAEYNEELSKAAGKLMHSRPIAMSRGTVSKRRAWPSLPDTGWGS